MLELTTDDLLELAALLTLDGALELLTTDDLLELSGIMELTELIELAALALLELVAPAKVKVKLFRLTSGPLNLMRII